MKTLINNGDKRNDNICNDNISTLKENFVKSLSKHLQPGYNKRNEDGIKKKY